MYLMRLGEPGSERPVARVDDQTYVDLSDVVADFDERFFGSAGIERIRPIVDERARATRPPGAWRRSPAISGPIWSIRTFRPRRLDVAKA